MNIRLWRCGSAIARVLVLTILPLIALQGCSVLKAVNFAGSNDPETEIKGKRVSILAFEEPLTVSESLASIEVEVPRPYLNEDWPQTGGYSSHTMYNLRGPATLRRLWRVRVGEGGGIGSRVVMSPIVAEGRVFAMDTKVRVAAFDAKSGRGLWRTSLAVSPEKPEVGFGGGLAYDEGKVFVATGFGDVFALDPKDGAIFWRQKLEEPFRTPPTVFGGRIYVTSFDNQLFVLSSSDGRVLWNYRAISEGAHILAETSPAVSGDAMVAPFSSGELVAFLADSGQVTWQDSLTRTGRFTSISTLNDIAGSPVIDRGQVFAVSHSGRMVAVDLRSGQRIWSEEIASIETPWVAGDFIYLVTTEGQLVCLYKRDGSIKWINQLKAYRNAKTRKRPIVWSGPVMVGGELLLVSSDRRAYAFSPSDGTELRKFRLPDKVYTAPIVANNIVYIYTNDAELIAYGDPAQAGRSRASRAKTGHEAKPEPGEIPENKRSFWEPRMPDWVPIF